MGEKHPSRVWDSAPPTPSSSASGSFPLPSRTSRASSTTYAPLFRSDPADEGDVFVEHVPDDQDTDDLMLLAPWRRAAVRLLGLVSVLLPVLIATTAKIQLSMLPKESRMHGWSDGFGFVRVNALLDVLLMGKRPFSLIFYRRRVT